jgi:hypothetical protein
MMLEGTEQWLDKYGDKFSTLWWFAGGGGLGISDQMDENELMRMMTEHPFTAYCDVEVQICVDPRTGIDTFKSVAAERVAAMSAA